MNSDTAHCYRPFVALFFAAPAEFQCKISGFLDVQKNCIASHCTFSDVNMVIFKSYLDLHLSESDWCGFVVEFGLSDLTEKLTRDGNRIKILNPTLALTPLGLLSPWRCHPTLI